MLAPCMHSQGSNAPHSSGGPARGLVQPREVTPHGEHVLATVLPVHDFDPGGRFRRVLGACLLSVNSISAGTETFTISSDVKFLSWVTLPPAHAARGWGSGTRRFVKSS